MSRLSQRAANSRIAIRRRELMLGLATVGVVGAGTAGIGRALADAGAPATALAAPPPVFTEMSRFVTGSAIDDAGALGRAWSQLTALDAGFAQAVSALGQAVRGAGLRDMTAFLASPLAKQPALLATVRTLTATWYLGGTGAPASGAGKDTSGFVTYAGALMYRPTLGMTVIPSYARGATDYWIDPPAGTPIPKGAAGIRDWPTTPAPSKKSVA